MPLNGDKISIKGKTIKKKHLKKKKKNSKLIQFPTMKSESDRSLHRSTIYRRLNVDDDDSARFSSPNYA